MNDNKLIDSKKIIDAAPDSVSRVLSRMLISLMGIDKLNKFYSSLNVKLGEPEFASNVFEAMHISTNVKGSELPSGPFIAVVPVVSGVLELVAVMSEIIEKSGRDDVKILPLIKGMYNFEYLSSYILTTKSLSKFSILEKSKEFLSNGGALIYFVKMNSSEYKFDSESFTVPCRLAKLTNVPIVNVLVDYDANLDASITTKLGEWVYNIFFIKRFLSHSNTSISVIFDKPYLCDCNDKDDNRVATEFNRFFRSYTGIGAKSVFNAAHNLKNNIRSIVSRGTVSRGKRKE